VKVLHVIPSVSPVRGGPSQAALELVKALVARGVEAEIVATNDDGPNLLDVPLGEVTEYLGAPVRFFPRFSPPIRPVWEFAYSGAFSAWFEQHARDYDSIHFHAMFSHLCTAGMAIARKQGIPYIVRPLGLLCTWSLQQGALKKKIYLNLIERANLNGSRGLEFTARQELDEAAPLQLTAPGFIIPFGLFEPTPIPDAREKLRQELKLPPDEPIVLFLSRIHPKKGLDHLIPALGQIADERFTLVIAGSGAPEHEAEVREAITNAKLRDRARMVGFVQGEAKERLLQGSDIFALTSYSESFGLAVLEAAAAGLDTVVTPGVPLAPVVATHQLGPVPPLDVEKIAQTLRQSLHDLQDAEKVNARRDRARRLIAEQYTWEQIAANLEKTYAAILAGDRIPELYVQ